MSAGDKPKIFTHEYYQRLYDVEDRHWWCRGVRAVAASLLEPCRGERASWRVLDAGCGTGVTLEWLSHLGLAGEGIALDLSIDALRFCQSRGQRAVLQGTAIELPFADASFDLIVCMDVVQHLPLPDGDLQAAREFHRVLRPGGLLLVRSNARRVGDPPRSREKDYRRYDLGELGDVFTSAGFHIERLTCVNAIDAFRDRLFPRKMTEEMKQTHTDHGLPLRLLPPWLSCVNQARYLALKAEGAYLRRRGRVIQHGHSTLALVRKGSAGSR